MPVTIKTAPHSARKYPAYTFPDTAQTFFNENHHYRESAEKLLSSSFVPNQSVRCLPNGFVNAVVKAYSHHYHLVIRPDDVWISIISLLSFYINAHAETLRKKFVAHDGKKKLELIIPPSTLQEINWNYAGDGMIKLMDENLVDKDLKEWITPDFTTTTRTDKTVSAILMMACMKSYFEYNFRMWCGIPSVTLEGTKEDWLKIQKRLEKLDTWGEETTAWHRMLKPILKKFISAFDGEVDDDFWGHVVTNGHLGSGTNTLGGWITAFCAFSVRGRFIENFKEDIRGWSGAGTPYVLDGVTYPIIDDLDIPSGSAAVDVTIIDTFNKEWPSILIAGNMGMKVIAESVEGDVVQNVPMWCCCLKKS
jgi:hypothetical protein